MQMACGQKERGLPADLQDSPGANMAPLLLPYSLKRQKCFPLSCAVGRFGRFGKVSGLSKTLHTEASLSLQNAFPKNQETGILVPSISRKESWNFCFKHPFLPCDLAGAIFRVLGLWVAFWVYSERAVPSEGTEAGPSLQNHVPSTRLIHSANLFSALSKQRHCGMWSFSREKKTLYCLWLQGTCTEVLRQLDHQFSSTTAPVLKVWCLVLLDPCKIQT